MGCVSSGGAVSGCCGMKRLGCEEVGKEGASVPVFVRLGQGGANGRVLGEVQ